MLLISVKLGSTGSFWKQLQSVGILIVIFNWHKLAPSLEEVYRLSGLLHIGELGIVVPRSGYTSLLRDSLGLRQDELKLGYAGGDLIYQDF